MTDHDPGAELIREIHRDGSSLWRGESRGAPNGRRWWPGCYEAANGITYDTRLFGSAGHGHAFERVGRNISYLKRQIRLNGATNARIHEVAVIRRTGTVAFAVSPGGVHREGDRLMPRVSC